ncbi:hypothetical protein ACHAW5_011084 [Stephanodiscus triporus]|uniref:BTB domain-containing protein n=1 Tax=Stephanodiscus triporus TaxID=2934178 RepID=A0ABD3QMJ7_9STRA
MIPSITIPPSAREAAMETKEEVMRAFQSLYSQVSCTDLSAMKQIADCVPLNGGGGDVTLDWRADPFHSKSDLTLNIYDGKEDGQPTPYYAHTLLLVQGGRRSAFVAEQVRGQRRRARNNNNNSNSNSNSNSNNNNNGDGFGRRAYDMLRQNSNASSESKGSGVAEYVVDVHVPALAARHVPVFLDYVYGSSLRLTTSNAPPLRYLSNRFDCRDLHREVTSVFIPRDLTLGAAPRYCAMADELKDYELRDRAIRMMAERFEKIRVDTLRCMEPRLMRRLLQCERLGVGSESLSLTVARYLRLMDCGASPDDVDRSAASATDDGGRGGDGDRTSPSSLSDEDFYWLTHCQIMPKISPREALFYYAYGARYPRVMSEVGSGSLKSRCLAACSDGGWAIERLASHVERGGDSMNDPLDAYVNLDANMKVDLLESMIVGARRSIAEKEKQSVRREEVDREARLSDEIMYKSNEEISASSAGHDGSVSKAIVHGCGVAPANGIYLSTTSNGRATKAEKDTTPAGHRHRRRGDADGDVVVVYEREAVWNGRRVTFLLYPVTSGQFYLQYKLGVRPHDDNNDNRETATTKTRVLYTSPKIVVGDASVGRCVVIPEHEWELEGDDAFEGFRPPPQFVGRVERPAALICNNSLVDSPPERGGWAK